MSEPSRTARQPWSGASLLVRRRPHQREIPEDSSSPVAPRSLSPNALHADGRLLTSLLPHDSWFNPPASIDSASGRITRIPSDNLSDYQSIGWTPDGQVMALKIGLRATIWKFQPIPR